jgi:mono/diheme cytochrome c family protein
MKKILFASIVVAFAAACTPKAVPTTSTPAPASSTPSTTATPAPASTPATAAVSPVEAGHTVYNAKCGRCHGLKEVGNYTASQWDPILESMAPKARLSSEETENVRAYVKANAKK